jgi:DNA-binding transcriptional MerR regulator
MKSLEGQAMTSPQPHAAHGHRIAEAARQSGVSAANIRFYEKEKLVQAHRVSSNGYRAYSPDDIRKLRFVRRLRSLGMSLEEMRVFLGLDLRRKQDCATAQVTLDQHIAHVKTRLAELCALEQDLAALRLRCDGTASHCLLIEALSEETDVPSGMLAVHSTRHQSSHM